MTISRFLKWCKKSWLKIGGGDVDEWLKGGGGEGGDLFQSEFPLIVSSSFQSELFYSACFDSKFSTNSVHLILSKAIWTRLLKVPAGSTFEMIVLYH